MTTTWRTPGLLAVVPHGRATDLLMSENTWRDVGGIISIADPYSGKRPPRIGYDRVPYRLALSFDDVEYERPGEYVAPTRDDVDRMLAFGRAFDRAASGETVPPLPVAGKRLVVHCHAGISRSTACALAIVAQRLGPGNEALAVREVAEATESRACMPNELITRYADEALGRSGRLLGAMMEFVNAEKTVGGVLVSAVKGGIL